MGRMERAPNSRFNTDRVRFATNIAARNVIPASGWRAVPLPHGSRTRWPAMNGLRRIASNLAGLPQAQ